VIMEGRRNHGSRLNRDWLYRDKVYPSHFCQSSLRNLINYTSYLLHVSHQYYGHFR